MQKKTSKYRMTPQKKEIFKIISESNGHLNAEEIFQKARKKFPQMSFATVYSNLKKFAEQGLIQEMHCGENCIRYELNTEPHFHIINKESGEIKDIYIEKNKIPIPKELKNTPIKRIKITYFI